MGTAQEDRQKLPPGRQDQQSQAIAVGPVRFRLRAGFKTQAGAATVVIR